jgi:hypothetical protein
MKRLFAVMTAALLMTAMVASAASASAPPQKYGQQCYKGLWATFVGTSGPFADQSACVSYVNKGGVLYPKTPTSLTSTITGPENGIGALVGNPQSRTAGGFTDPAMRFTVAGTGWVPGTIHLSYTADAPLGYTFDNPTAYMSPPAQYPVTSSGAAGSFSSFFQDNCFDLNNVLVSGNVSYTITATGLYGQTKTVAGTLNCDLIPATLTATVTGPEPGIGALAGQGDALRFTLNGWHWTATDTISIFYAAGPPLSYSYSDPTSYMSPPAQFPVVVGSDGSFNSFFQDNCVGGAGLASGFVPFTITATDGATTASVTGNMNCSLLAP